MGVYLLTPRPTFTRYFLLTVPFLAIPAAYGLYEVTIRLATRPRPWLATGILCAILAYGETAALFGERDDMMWKDMQNTADKVRDVTPPSATLPRRRNRLLPAAPHPAFRHGTGGFAQADFFPMPTARKPCISSRVRNSTS